jgi:transposase
MRKSITIAVDHAKSVFEIAVSDYPGHVKERHRLSRSRFVPFFTERQAATVLLEACGSAHHWGRCLQLAGHHVVLLPPHAVRPYVARNKTDRADAKGLLEAFRNRDIHPVPIKSVEQQAIAALHRLRSAWLATRTARINTVRGLLREFGVTIPVGARKVVPHVQDQIGNADSQLPELIKPLLAEACAEITEIEHRIDNVDRQLASLAKVSCLMKRLLTVPGVGLITATALVATIGDIHRFPSGRHFAAFIGLTPREHSSGSIRRLGAISRRGDAYLRMLLIHGARSVLVHASSSQPTDRLRVWANNLMARRGHNKATVALANKIARRVWAVWARNTDFEEVSIA